MKHKIAGSQFYWLILSGIIVSALVWAAENKPNRVSYDAVKVDSLPIYLPSVANYSIYAEIRTEALAQNSETKHPLPLLSSWNASTWWNYNTSTAGLSPSWQLDNISSGHHLLPWFNIPLQDNAYKSNEFNTYANYYKLSLQNTVEHKLPISFVGTQWEEDLYNDPAYFNLPPAQNPNVISTNGTIQKKISPFGLTQNWYSLGIKWGSSKLMQQVITWYPNPPLVLFISNNEASKLKWTEAETDKRYLDLYGTGRDDNFKRGVFAKAWQERYKALIQGFRDGLNNTQWQSVSKFMAYQAFGPGFFGSWYQWKEYSLYIPNQIDPNPLFWEGGSPSLYICADVCGERDNNIQGPLFQAMNWVFIQKEAHTINPTFWFEFSSWDGDTTSHNAYTKLGQSFTPARYGGFVQYGMWLTRPRLVRFYRDWDQTQTQGLPWFTPVMNAVDRVYADPVLQLFWRTSDNVANPARVHPYQYDIPTEYSTINRMYLLSTNLDPKTPWSMQTEFPVMSLARVRGSSPNRQWLVYAYAPLGAKQNVKIDLPGYGPINVNVLVEGSFYLVNENEQTINLLNKKK